MTETKLDEIIRTAILQDNVERRAGKKDPKGLSGYAIVCEFARGAHAGKEFALSPLAIDTALGATEWETHAFSIRELNPRPDPNGEPYVTPGFPRTVTLKRSEAKQLVPGFANRQP